MQCDMKTKRESVCDVCGKSGARVRRMTRTYGKGKELLVIENVPVVSCPACGECYITAKAVFEVERIKAHRKQLAAKRPVAVASYR